MVPHFNFNLVFHILNYAHSSMKFSLIILFVIQLNDILFLHFFCCFMVNNISKSQIGIGTAIFSTFYLFGYFCFIQTLLMLQNNVPANYLFVSDEFSSFCSEYSCINHQCKESEICLNKHFQPLIVLLAAVIFCRIVGFFCNIRASWCLSSFIKVQTASFSV